MGAEKALFRIQISSGTQAIVTALFGVLRPGDRLLSVTGIPYDSLHESLGIDEQGVQRRSQANQGSLADFNIGFSFVNLNKGDIDIKRVLDFLLEHQDVKMIYVQRSRGYGLRRALFLRDIEQLCQEIRALKREIVVFVDNCYGEFIDIKEPCHIGADLVAGSLIKNPGGGLAPSGAYICGRENLIEQVAARMTAPGLGAEIGPSLGFNRLLTQGLFMSAHVVSECLHGLCFAAAMFEKLGYKTAPASNEERGDIIQTVQFEDKSEQIAFCQAIQQASPVDSFVKPVPDSLPGYAHEVIMAAGTFIQGASIELSADGPIAEPYIAYMQGGLNYYQVKLAVLLAVSQEELA